jgi:arylsulfatase A-like enzyme
VKWFLLHIVFALALALNSRAAGVAKRVVVVVWDGMRPDFISTEHTPTLANLASNGVFFAHHHSVYCTATDVNGTAIATGQQPQRSGIIANKIFRPEINPLKPVFATTNEVIRKGDELTHGNFLLTPTVAEILQAAGKHTVIAGAKDVATLHDRRERDDATHGALLSAGETQPVKLTDDLVAALGKFPKAAVVTNKETNSARDEWTTRALVGELWGDELPEFSLLWLSEPDHSQHADGPGSAKALAALESSDRQLATVLAQLERRGLRADTDVFIVSDHGFSTIAHVVDAAKELQAAGFKAAREFKQPMQPGEILVAGQGGSVLCFVHGHDAAIAKKLAAFFQQQSFTGVVFAREKISGTFPLAAGNLASPDAPDIAVSLRWSPEKSKAGVPGTFYSDKALTSVADKSRVGAGNHASLSPFDTHNTFVAAGPDFARGLVSELPSGNTDLAPTILWLLGVPPAVPMDGRVLSEALVAKNAPRAAKLVTKRLEATQKFPSGTWSQYLQTSRVGKTVYLDEGNGAFAEK